MTKITIIKAGQKPAEILSPSVKAARYIEVKNYIRSCREMGHWTRAVRERDQNTCTECGARNVSEVHHKHGLKQIIVENDLVTPEAALKCAAIWDVSNGVVLCPACHRAKHPENH